MTRETGAGAPPIPAQSGRKPLGLSRFGARAAWLVLRLVPIVFVAALFVWPVAALVHRVLEPASTDGGGSESIGTLLGRTHALDLLGTTLGQAAASTALTLVVAMPLVWLFVRVGDKAATALTVFVTIPFVLPTVVVGIAFRALLTGPLAGTGLDAGWWPVLAAHVFLNVAVVVRVVGAAWRALDPRLTEAARTLGASPLRAWLTVTAPRLAPAVGGSAALVFLFCSTSFGVIIILGGGTLRTLETEIYTQAIGYFRIPEAVALSMLQIVVVVVALALTRIVSAPGGAAGGAGGAVAATAGPRRQTTSLPGRSVCVLWGLLILAGPVVVLAVRSVHPTSGGGWTLAGYRALGVSVNGTNPLATLRYSLTTALMAMLIAVVVGTLASMALHRSSGAARLVGSALALIPLGISAVTLGFGYLLVLAALPSQVASSPLVIPCVQALISMPVVVGIVLPALDAVPQRQRQAAATLGAGPVRVFRDVDLPMIGRSVTAAAGFAFVMSMGEFGATSFLARADTTTLPVLIGSALNRPGAANLATAMAASMVLVAVTGVAMALVEILRGGGPIRVIRRLRDDAVGVDG